MKKNFIKQAVTVLTLAAIIGGQTLSVSAAPTDGMPVANKDNLLKYYEQNFDVETYKNTYKDLVDAFGADAPDSVYLNHYLEHGMAEGRTSGGFDAIAFIINNYDYFMENGMAWNFPFFNVEKYKAANPDLQAAFGNDLTAYLNHYLTHGIYEGRNSQGEIDIVYMAKLNPDMNLNSNIDLSAAPNIVTNFVEQVKAVEADRVAEVKASVQAYYSDVQQSVFLGGSVVKDEENKIFYNRELYEQALQAWMENEPMVDAYLAETTYDADMEAWKAAEPNINDFLSEEGQQAYQEWLDSEPNYEEYLMNSSFGGLVQVWEESAPKREDFTVGYVNEEAAQEALNADHEEWEANAPKAEDYRDATAFEEAMDAYRETNPEPVVEDYPYFEDGYTDAEAAQLAYNAAMQQWEDSKPQTETEEELQAKIAEWIAENPAPVEDDYVYVENTYKSAEEAAQALADAQAAYEAALLVTEPNAEDYVYVENEYASQEEATQQFTTDFEAWETARDEALGGLTEEDEGYMDTLNTFLESNPQPTEDDYVYVENEYASQEEANEALAGAQQDYEDAQAIIEAGEPNADDYVYVENDYASQEEANQAFEDDTAAWENNRPVAETEEEYQAKVDAWVEENAAPEESTFTDKINEYESQEDATAKFEEDHTAWEENAPKAEDYLDDDAYNEALEEYVAENPEPTIDNGDYELGDYATEEEADAAYEDAVVEHEESAPVDDGSYIEETTYGEDHDAWEADEPDVSEDLGTNEEGVTYEDAITEWETSEPNVDEYIEDTTYDEDHATWVEEEPRLEDFVEGNCESVG